MNEQIPNHDWEQYEHPSMFSNDQLDHALEQVDLVLHESTEELSQSQDQRQELFDRKHLLCTEKAQRIMTGDYEIEENRFRPNTPRTLAQIALSRRERMNQYFLDKRSRRE